MNLNLEQINKLPEQLSELSAQVLHLTEIVESSTKTRHHYTRKQAAEYLECSVAMVDKLAQSGRLSRLKVGSKTVFSKSNLDQVLNNEV